MSQVQNVNVTVPPAAQLGESSIAACLALLDGLPVRRGEIEAEAKTEPLMLANALVLSAKRGNVECVRRLLKTGAPPNGVGEIVDGRTREPTPLVEAIGAASVPAVKELLDYGADPNLRSSALEDEGYPPLVVAASKSTEAAKLLLQYGALVDAADATGLTALHAAAFRGDLSLVKLLVERGARRDVRDKHSNDTPVQRAVAAGHASVAAWLSAAEPAASAPTESSAGKPSVMPKSRWEIASAQRDPVGASRSMRSIVDRELNSEAAADGPPLRMTIDVAGSERIPPPGESRSYDVRLTFAGAPHGECATTLSHEERRFGANDPAFSPSDLAATSAAITRIAQRYVSSGGKDCS